MELKYHTCADVFYNEKGELYPNPIQSLEELENMYCEAISMYKILKEREEKFLSSNINEDDDLIFDLAMSNFNLENLIGSLEWKLDLKFLHEVNK